MIIKSTQGGALMRFSQMKTGAKQKKGFTLIEAAIVMAIVGLVVGGIWVAASAVQANFRKSNTSQNLLVIVQNMRQLYYGQADCSAATAQIEISNRVFPADMVQGTAAAQDSWGGPVTITCPSAIDSNVSHFDVSFAQVPTAACVELSSRNTEDGAELGLLGVKANSTTLFTAGTTSASVAVTTANATTACAGDQNTIIWTFNFACVVFPKFFRRKADTRFRCVSAFCLCGPSKSSPRSGFAMWIATFIIITASLIFGYFFNLSPTSTDTSPNVLAPAAVASQMLAWHEAAVAYASANPAAATPTGYNITVNNLTAGSPIYLPACL